MPLSAEALKQARINKGLSQNQVAEKLHVTRQTVSRWENGRGYPDMDNLADLADLYNVPYEILFDKEPRDLSDLPRLTFSSKYSVYALLVLGIGGWILFRLGNLEQFLWANLVALAMTALFNMIVAWEFYWNVWGKVRHNKKKIANQERLERELANKQKTEGANK